MNNKGNDLKHFGKVMNVLTKYKTFMSKADYDIIDECVKLWFIGLDGNNIKFIDNPTYKMRIDAIKNNPESLMWINEPTEEMVFGAINISPVCIQLSNKLYINCVYRVLEIDKGLISVIEDMASTYKNRNKDNFKILDKIMKDFKYC